MDDTEVGPTQIYINILVESGEEIIEEGFVTTVPSDWVWRTKPCKGD